MIAFAHTRAASEVDFTTMMETSDDVDPTLREQIDLVPERAEMHLERTP